MNKLELNRVLQSVKVYVYMYLCVCICRSTFGDSKLCVCDSMYVCIHVLCIRVCLELLVQDRISGFLCVRDAIRRRSWLRTVSRMDIHTYINTHGQSREQENYIVLHQWSWIVFQNPLYTQIHTYVYRTEATRQCVCCDYVEHSHSKQR